MASFEFDLEADLLKLEGELRQRTYQLGSYTNFYIYEPKRRLVSAAPFRDRVVHHALCRVIEPVWERRFISDSYANRKGKGTHRAILRCNQFARQYAYVLQCDLKQFFPSIDVWCSPTIFSLPEVLPAHGQRPRRKLASLFQPGW